MRNRPELWRHLRWAILVLTFLAAAGCGGASKPTQALSTPTSPGHPRVPVRPRARSHTVVPAHQRRPPVRRRRGPSTLLRPPNRLLRPPIVWRPIPFGPLRKAQTVAYARRHYGRFFTPTWRLIHPQVIVIHYTDASFAATFNTFASDTPDSELHELPATCAHFVIDQDGTIYQLVSLGTMCRHAVGLNWTAIGVEQVGYSDAQVLADRRQITASLRLVHWLRCRFKIQPQNVIGHNESLSSPYHREDVASLRTQTHADFGRADMQVYQARLRPLGGC